MAVIDRIAYEPERFGGQRTEDMLVWRWPSDELSLGCRVVVNQSQEAVFFKGGQVCDVFGPGTHTLATGNLPLLRRVINLPFGGRTPFAAEVYFVNKASQLDVRWGTSDRFRLTDPKYHIIVPVGAFGKLGFKVSDSRTFVTRIVDALTERTTDAVRRYMEGLVVTKVKDIIGKLILEAEVSIMDIAPRLDELSNACGRAVSEEFGRFGMEVLNFFVMSVNVPDDHPSVLKIQEVMAGKAEIEQLGENYRLKRAFDALQAAAENPGGIGGAAIAGGLGLGFGLGAAPALGANLGETLKGGVSGPGQKGADAGAARSAAERMAEAKEMLDSGTITQEEFDAVKNRILDQM